jgi:putative transposase
MNKAKCNEYDYINFLVAAQGVYSAVEASRTAPEGEGSVAHDAYTRLLQRLPPDSSALWREVAPYVEQQFGILVVDDTTLDKPHAQKMALVTRHWSGKHGAVVSGINLISLVWTDGDCCLPVDYRVYNKDVDGLDKNDHFRTMLETAHERGFAPAMVVFDGWYSSLDNLKALRQWGWHWLTRLKSNRQVSLRKGLHQSVADLDIPATGVVVHLRGYGFIKVFRTVDPHGNAEHWATSHVDLPALARQAYADRAWRIEEFHRSIKQFTGVERGQFRLEVSQRNHIGLALRAFVRLELHRCITRLSHFHAKHAILRDAIRAYRFCPTLRLPALKL